MIENVLSNLGGVGAYGVISIGLFFALFAGVLLWVALLGKPYLDEMKALPLEDDPPESESD